MVHSLNGNERNIIVRFPIKNNLNLIIRWAQATFIGITVGNESSDVVTESSDVLQSEMPSWTEIKAGKYCKCTQTDFTK